MSGMIRGVDIGAMRQQEFNVPGLSVQSGLHKERVAIRIAAVNIHSVFDGSPDGGRFAAPRRLEQVLNLRCLADRGICEPAAGCGCKYQLNYHKYLLWGMFDWP
jgi:hypothetical protein